MKRIYVKHSAKDLEKIVEVNISNLKELKKVQHELIYRKTDLAKQLQKRVDKIIYQLERIPSIKIEQGTLVDFLPKNDVDTKSEDTNQETITETKEKEEIKENPKWFHIIKNFFFKS